MNAMEIERSHELNAQSHRILVIDDNPSIHEDFRKILCPAAAADDLAEDEAAIYGQAEIVTELAHFEIDSAYQGREGLAMVEKAQADNRPYSMAFVDVRMPPGWDGIESIQHIWKSHPDLQIVICTAFSDYSCEEIIKTLGKSDSLLILKKPFDNAEVLQIAYAMTKKWVVTCQARFRLENLESVVESRTMELVRANRQLGEEVKRRADAEKELRKAVETLRSSEEHLRLAGQVMGVGTYEYDLATNKRFLSPAMRAMYGVDETEPAPFKAFSERLVMEDQAGFLAALASSSNCESGGHFDHEHRVKQSDGSLRWLHSQAQTWFEGEGAERRPVMIVGVVTDITERKQSEIAVRKLAAIIESSDDAIIGKDLNGIVTSWNPGAEKHFGYSASDMVGTSITRLIPLDRHEEEIRILGKIRCGESVEHFETLRQTKDGRLIDVSLTASPIKDASGKVIGVSKVARCITERKRSEAALEQAHKELVVASRQAGIAEFATGVLHNVGNVLHSVNIASTCVAESLKKSKAANLSKVVSLLREHESDLGAYLGHDPKGKQIPAYLAQLGEQLVAEQTAALHELAGLQKNIEHIKEVVKGQQGGAKGIGKSESVQVTDLLEDTLRMHSDGHANRDLQVVREFETVPPITVEKNKVLQILMNLVRNASQACEEAGCVEKRLTLRVTNGDDRVRIAVSDNGVGISPDGLTQIFAHGFTTKRDGHGFGLHSAATAAKEMGASLTVQSEGLGRGATFILELPIKSE